MGMGSPLLSTNEGFYRLAVVENNGFCKMLILSRWAYPPHTFVLVWVVRAQYNRILFIMRSNCDGFDLALNVYRELYAAYRPYYSTSFLKEGR
jgi:hypothetical protein